MALALNGGAGNRGLVLFAMHKRNITAIYTTFYSSTFEGAFAFHFFFWLSMRSLLCHAPLGPEAEKWTWKMRKRSVLSTFRWAWNFDCDSESEFCASRWELDYFPAACCCFGCFGLKSCLSLGSNNNNLTSHRLVCGERNSTLAFHFLFAKNSSTFWVYWPVGNQK